jgi:hypothetical protein
MRDRRPREELVFLIVDGQESTRESLAKGLQHEHPQAFVDTADTVASAQSRIDQTLAENLRYKVAILDCLIAATPEADPGLSFKVANHLLEHRGAEILYHATVAVDQAREYIAACYSPRITPQSLVRQYVWDRRTFLEERPEADWSALLLEDIARTVHGDRILDRYERLFGEAPEGGGTFRGFRRSTRESRFDPTLELSMLATDIECHWHQLDPKFVQPLLQTRFKIIKEGDNVKAYLR